MCLGGCMHGPIRVLVVKGSLMERDGQGEKDWHKA